MFSKKALAEFFVTVCYIGKIKFCPGTFGSLVAFPVYCAVALIAIFLHLTLLLGYQEPDFFWLLFGPMVNLFIIECIVCCILFIFGAYFTNMYLKTTTKKDPAEIVIDEVVGQLLTINLCIFSVVFVAESSMTKIAANISFCVALFLPFVLFRFFDIVKPWPINWADKNVPGAIGVMCDDIIAAIFASVVHYAIIFIMIDNL